MRKNCVIVRDDGTMSPFRSQSQIMELQDAGVGFSIVDAKHAWGAKEEESLAGRSMSGGASLSRKSMPKKVASAKSVSSRKKTAVNGKSKSSRLTKAGSRRKGSGMFAVSSAVDLGLDGEGRIIRKVEKWSTPLEYTYSYDAKGKLAFVYLNGREIERYVYNAKGQRIADVCLAHRAVREHRYDARGRLVAAGPARYHYTDGDSLCCREQRGERMQLHYGDDTRLDAAILADGTVVKYVYGEDLGPVAKTVDGRVVEEFSWVGPTQLLEWVDHMSGYTVSFCYNGGPLPVAAKLRTKKAETTLHLGYDQVGSLKAFTTDKGKLIKEIVCDSFGNLLEDSNPQLFLPIGFAGGLSDRHTGLIRFGFRDYDPQAGRFTAMDPARDMRGDGDLWDYCIDDPVNAQDRSGLFWNWAVGAGVGGVIGGAMTAWNNWDAYEKGEENGGISGWDYAKTVGLGALTGAASGAVGNFTGAVAAGGIMSGVNEAGQQIIRDKDGNVTDWKNVGIAAGSGGIGGLAGAAGGKAGNLLIKDIDPIGKVIKRGISTYERQGAIIGNTAS